MSKPLTVVCADALRERRPLVSVCVVAYNQEAYVGEAIESVLAQRVGFDYELIVGDDCSTDGTRGVLERYQRAHPERIRLHLHEEHYQGLPAKLNMVTNLEAARGRYVALLDGDDAWISRDKLQRQTDYLERHPDVSASFHDALTVFEGDAQEALGERESSYRLSERYADTMAASGRFFHDDVVDSCQGGRPFLAPAASIMFRRRLFEPVPGWFWRVWNADQAMLIHCARHGPIQYHHDLLSLRRKHAGSMTVSFQHTLDQNGYQIRQVPALCEVTPLYDARRHWTLYALYRQRVDLLWRAEQYPGAVSSALRAAYHGARSSRCRRMVWSKLRTMVR